MRYIVFGTAILAYLFLAVIGVFAFSIVSWEPQTGYIRDTFLVGIPTVYGIYSIAFPQKSLFSFSENTVLSAGFGTRISIFRELYVDLSASASQTLGADLRQFFDAVTFRNGLRPQDILVPWPSFDASLSLDLDIVRLILGLRTDIYLASFPNMPATLARGFSYSDTWLNESFTSWTRWYVGLRF